MKTKVYCVYRGYRSTEAIAVYYNPNRAVELIKSIADANNGGIYRMWTMDNVDYYDCGLNIYKVVEKDLQEIKDNLLT